MRRAARRLFMAKTARGTCCFSLRGDSFGSSCLEAEKGGQQRLAWKAVAMEVFRQERG